MFTGIIEASSKVLSLDKKDKGMVMAVAAPKGWKFKVGDSVNVSGVCSTVKKSGKQLEFFYMPETLAKSNLGLIQKGGIVNLERSMLATSRLDGHIVQGHADATASLANIRRVGDSFVVEIALSPNQKNFMKYVAPKGSVALEGISLTVVDVSKLKFSVHLIPHTWQVTNLHTKKVGDKINVEFDVLAKYLDRIINAK